MNHAERLFVEDNEPESGVIPIAHSPVAMGDVEPLIDAIDDARLLGFDEWKRGVEGAAGRLFEGGRADVQVVSGSPGRRIDDSEGALRVSGDAGSGTSVVLSIEHSCGALRASDRLRLKRVALHLENRAYFLAGGRCLGAIALDGSRAAPPRLWLELVHGRASVVRDDGGYRVLAAPASWARHRAFNATQTQIVNLVSGGAIYKTIAHELRLSSPAVSHALAMASAKVGVRKPFELFRIAHAFSCVEGEAKCEAKCQSGTAHPHPHDRLTISEREVLALVMTGLSNRSIARARNRSLRTVANQVAALLRKLDCASRYQLAAGTGTCRAVGNDQRDA